MQKTFHTTKKGLQNHETRFSKGLAHRLKNLMSPKINAEANL